MPIRHPLLSSTCGCLLCAVCVASNVWANWRTYLALVLVCWNKCSLKSSYCFFFLFVSRLCRLRVESTMDGNSTGNPLPNPSTVLAFLPPTLANQYQAACYVYVACLAVSAHLYWFFTLYTLFLYLCFPPCKCRVSYGIGSRPCQMSIGYCVQGWVCPS